MAPWLVRSVHPPDHPPRVVEAAAIGGLLRSVVAITVWSIALLTILPLLGIDIARVWLVVFGIGAALVALVFAALECAADHARTHATSPLAAQRAWAVAQIASTIGM